MLADLRNLLSIAYVSILGKYVQKLNVLVLWADSSAFPSFSYYDGNQG